MTGRFVVGSQVRILHCAATVMSQTRDKSDLQHSNIPEQEMKNKFILIGAVLVAIIATVFLYTQREQVSPQTTSVQSPSTTSSTPEALRATLKVGDKTYSVLITSGETVLDAMRTLASTSDFIFNGRDYAGLGFFVDSINGTKNEGGMYWILYINGVLASNGVSATTLKTGDVAEWKYEKGY